MNIQFYNHACFSIENDSAILLNDPYLSGTAFNDGWDLIINDIVFDNFTAKKLFIYYSHEHPDHFSIPFLKLIKAEKRKEITILFQKTRDGRVKSYLEKEGFFVKELKNKRRFEFSRDFYITIGQVPFYDSWALIEVDHQKIINVNDCILEVPDRIKDIKSITSDVDILFTQFSYANWVEGGVENKRSRLLLAQEKLDRIKTQSDVLNPKFIVPFASMVRFCHIENSYMNDAINTPKQTVSFIEKNTSAKPFLMKPYESWNGIDSKNNDISILFWEEAYNKALTRELIRQKKLYDFKTIKKVCEEMIARVKNRNNAIIMSLIDKIGLLPSQIIKIVDLNCIVKFSWRNGIAEIDVNSVEEYIEMSSESIYFLFKLDFGIDTLNVNARFTGSLEQKKSFIRTFSPLILNNTGRYISLLGLVSSFSEPAFIKQGLRTVGLVR